MLPVQCTHNVRERAQRTLAWDFSGAFIEIIERQTVAEQDRVLRNAATSASAAVIVARLLQLDPSIYLSIE